MNKICSFFGHRKVENAETVFKDVVNLVEKLIREKGYNIFLFGGFGEFDELCHNAITVLKERYPHIQRVYCVCDEKQLKKIKRCQSSFCKDYERTVYFAPTFDYWYTRIYYRNCEMIKQSECIIFYAKRQKDSGAYKALQYAIKYKKEYINVLS